jgi:flagellar protein FlaJ
MAGKTASADLYASTAMFSSLIAFIGVIIGGILFAWIMGLMTPLILVSIFIVAPIIGFVAYQFLMIYPGMIASDRGYKIDLALPKVIGFMHAMSRSGAGVVEIFRELSTRYDAGELRNEARMFMRDVEYLGHDPLTAVRDLARTTPSKRLRAFLEILAPVAETGGDITAYFASKWSEYQDDAKADQGEFISTLELYSELYITMVMLMPLLMLLVFALLGPLAGYSNTWLYLIAYIMIPIGSGAFIVLMSMSIPDKLAGKAVKLRALDVYKDVTVVDGGRHEERLRRSLSKGARRQELKNFFIRPVQAILMQPTKILFFSVPIAAVVSSLLYFRFSLDITACTISGVMTAITPYAVTYEVNQRKLGGFEDSLLDFLRAIASATKSGLPLPAALKIASTAELGPLTGEVKRMNADIEWGMSAGEALNRFEQRVSGSELVSRAVRTINKASDADEDIGDVLDILMRDVASKRELEREMSGAMGTYTIIILIMFGIFMFTVYMIANSILAMSTKGGTEIPLFGIDTPVVMTIFMHAAIIEGISAGLVAGQSRTGDLKTGLKYSILMMLLAYAVFAVLILPSLT